MVERTPHAIQLVLPGATVQDGKGDSVNGVPLATLDTTGRVKVAGSGQNIVIGTSGDVTPYHATVSMPYFEQDYSNGLLYWKGKEYFIIRFNKYQNRTKAWI